MKWKPSLHRNDTIDLNLWDMLKLLLGFPVQDGACIISLWSWDNLLKMIQNEKATGKK